jgi:hypothetical protein
MRENRNGTGVMTMHERNGAVMTAFGVEHAGEPTAALLRFALAALELAATTGDPLDLDRARAAVVRALALHAPAT